MGFGSARTHFAGSRCPGERLEEAWAACEGPDNEMVSSRMINGIGKRVFERHGTWELVA